MTDRDRQLYWRSRLIFVFGYTASATVASIAGRELIEPSTNFAYWISLTLVCGVFASLTGIFYIGTTYRYHTASGTEVDVPYAASERRSVTVGEVHLLSSDGINGPVGAAQAGFLARAIVRPPDVFARISEHIEQYHRSVKIVTNYTAALGFDGLPDSVSNTADVVVPLHIARRGQLLDGLRVTNGDGKRVSTLDGHRLAVYTAAAIRVQMAASGPVALRIYLDHIEPEVLAVFGDPHPTNEALQSVENKFDGFPPPWRPDSFSVAKALFRSITDSTLICAVLPIADIRDKPWPHQFRFTVEHRAIFRTDNVMEHSAQQTALRGLDRVRRFLGIKIHRIYFDIERAFLTTSYHLVAEGSPGTYLSRQQLLDWRPTGAGKEEPEPPTMRVRFAQREGQRRSHLYVTEAKNAVDSDGRAKPGSRGGVWYATAYFERAPGTFAPLVATTLAAAYIIWLVGTHELASITAPNLQPGLLPALLAIPVAATALSGLDMRRDTRHPALLTLFISLATVAESLLVYGIASGASPDEGDTMGIALRSTFWTAAIYTAFLIWGITVVAWVIRAKVELHFVQGKDRRPV